MSHFPKRKAFTLAEVLIALALLGIVAAFTVPKVLQSQQEARYTQAFKTYIATFTRAVHAANLESPLDPLNYVDTENKILAKINPIRTCGIVGNYNIYTANNPCFPDISCKPHTVCQQWDYQFIMADGSNVALTAAGSPTLIRYFLQVDGNGFAPPNTIGQDRLVIQFAVNGKISKPVQVYIPDGSSADTTNGLLYDRIW